MIKKFKNLSNFYSFLVFEFVVPFGIISLSIWAILFNSPSKVKAKTNYHNITVNEYKLEDGLVAKTFRLNGYCYIFVSGLEKGGLSVINCSGL